MFIFNKNGYFYLKMDFSKLKKKIFYKKIRSMIFWSIKLN